MIAKTPPMGWNSWDCYGASVTEETVRKNAEFMSVHLKKYGWEYIVVDIQWSEPNAKSHEYRPFADLCMDEYGRLLPAENRFPSSTGGKGFAPLAEYVHSLGLKFGIHIMRGIPRQPFTETARSKARTRLPARLPKPRAFARGIQICTALTRQRTVPARTMTAFSSCTRRGAWTSSSATTSAASSLTRRKS